MTFEDLGLAPALLKAVLDEGYDTPTPIQAQAIPLVMSGADVLAGAQTGTGKTAAFTLPLLHRLSMSRSAQNRFGGTGARALILTPTRELAAQVEESIRTYGKYLQLTSTVIFGGVGMNPQINALRRGVDIVVATPGRLLDLMGQGKVDLSTVQTLVLDEADRMLDMGFIHDVRKVLAVLPANKQALLFSATFSDEIRDLAATLLKNPQHVQVTPRNTTVQRISQLVHPVLRDKKTALLEHVIKTHNWYQVLVFCRTKHTANEVAQALCDAGIKSMALHGNKSQGARTMALAEFKANTLQALVATDIAARGIDIDELPHVVNYDIPNVSEDYVHRIGRTGRAGNEGFAVSFVSVDEEGFMQDIERFTKQQIPREIVPQFDSKGEQAMPIAMGRQTIWGGLGKMPSREVMAAAAKNARREMMERVNERKATTGGGGRSGSGRPGGGGGGRAPTGGGGGFGGARNNSAPSRNAPARSAPGSGQRTQEGHNGGNSTNQAPRHATSRPASPGGNFAPRGPARGGQRPGGSGTRNTTVR